MRDLRVDTVVILSHLLALEDPATGKQINSGPRSTDNKVMVLEQREKCVERTYSVLISSRRCSRKEEVSESSSFSSSSKRASSSASACGRSAEMMVESSVLDIGRWGLMRSYSFGR